MNSWDVSESDPVSDILEMKKKIESETYKTPRCFRCNAELPQHEKGCLIPKTEKVLIEAIRDYLKNEA